MYNVVKSVILSPRPGFPMVPQCDRPNRKQHFGLCFHRLTYLFPVPSGNPDVRASRFRIRSPMPLVGSSLHTPSGFLLDTILASPRPYHVDGYQPLVGRFQTTEFGSIPLGISPKMQRRALYRQPP